MKDRGKRHGAAGIVELKHPHLIMPQSLLFSHVSRLANTYEPGVEIAIAEAAKIPASTSSIVIEHRVAPPLAEQVFLGRRRHLRAWYNSRGTPVSLGERLFYDARWYDNENLAHLVQHHLASIGAAIHHLCISTSELHVLVDQQASNMVRSAFEEIGCQVVATDAAVIGNQLRVEGPDFFHRLPEVRHLPVCRSAFEAPEKIFLSRKSTRRLRNEDEIEKQLSAHGYTKIYCEELSIRDQWNVIGGATDIVAIHGAALGSLAFQARKRGNSGFRLVELFGAGFVVNPFRKYTALLQGKWAGCRGRITPEVARDIDLVGREKAHAHDDFELSVETLNAALDWIQESALADASSASKG